MGSVLALVGLASEVGELANAVIAHHQGRKGYGPTPEGMEKYQRDIRDAVADIQIFLADFCAQEGIDVEKVTMDTWNNIVRKRTIKNWEQHSHEKPAQSVLEQDGQLQQNGQGFAEPPEEKSDNPEPGCSLDVEIWPLGAITKAETIIDSLLAMLDGSSYERGKKLKEDFKTGLKKSTDKTA
jgi:hypothetical protein